jgi:outer membrane protein OmpA-like peptidoglycan-associated protein
MSSVRTLTAVTALALTLGCQILDTRTKQGAAAGTVAGAAAGAAIGGHEHAAGGALIGAAAGALTGGLIGNYLDRQAEELKQIEGASVERKEDHLVVNMQGGILFDTDSASLSPSGVEKVRTLAQTIQKYPRERVIVKGHTDSQGDDRYNQRLSEDRADSVRNLLVAEGVTPSRITAVGLGSNVAVASNSTAEGRQQNRRVEIELHPDDDVLQGGDGE